MSSVEVESWSLQTLASEVFGVDVARCRSTDHTINHNFGALHYKTWGDPSNPPLICLHGGGQSSSEFSLLGPALKNDHYVIALDYGGHGRTAWQYDQSTEYIASQVAAVALNEEIRRFDILGSSMGGLHAVAFAHTHPETVNRVIVGDILPTLRDGMIPKTQQYYTGFVNGEVTSRSELARLTLGVAKTDLGKETMSLMARELFVGIDGHYFGQFEPTVPDFIDRDSFAEFWSHFEGIQCPLQILLSAEHSFVPPESIHRATRDKPNVSSRTVPDCGHNLVIDNPVVVAQYAKEFLLAGR